MEKVKIIQGNGLQDLEEKINEMLAGGEKLLTIDLGSVSAAFMVKVYEEEKDDIERAEEVFGRHKCSECPLFHPSKDGRVKWTVCEKGKKTQAGFNCCHAYYENLRKEALNDAQGKAEGVRLEGGGCCDLHIDFGNYSTQQANWSY